MSNTIEKISYNGTDRQLLLNHSLENPVALTVHNNILYWIDT